MRVIAGRFRGRHLEAPEGVQTRPITDRVKESLFSILGSRFGTPGALPDFEILDLFAGTGGLGIEAVSRGAARCTFVEKDRRTLPVLKRNVAQLREPDRLRVIVDNAWAMRLPLAESESGFGLIFVDPPYRDVDGSPRTADLLERAGSRLSQDGIIALRCEVESEVNLASLQSLQPIDDRRYGRMRLILLAKNAAALQIFAPRQEVEEEAGTKHIGQHADRNLVDRDRSADAVAERQEGRAGERTGHE